MVLKDEYMSSIFHNSLPFSADRKGSPMERTVQWVNHFGRPTTVFMTVKLVQGKNSGGSFVY